MSGEFLSLSQLSPEPQIANTDRELLPIVLIANTEPEVLNTAVTGVFSESYLANAEHNQATQIYNKELEKSDPKTVSPELRFAAEKLNKTEKHLIKISDQTDLARDIHKKRTQLARPMRVATTVMCALAVGGAPAGYLYVDATKSAHRTQDQELTSGQEKAIKSTAALGGALGGFAGTFVGIGFMGREARRRARKIIAKQS